MKLLLISTLMLSISYTANAKDACSKQVKGYVAGLKAGSTLAAVNKAQQEKALKQIEYIKTLQKTLPDCKVVDHIPELKASKEALKFASEQVK